MADSVTPDDIIAYLRQCDIHVVHDPELPTCQVEFVNRGYRITLGKNYLAGSDQDRLMLLYHECSHIIRGDLLYLSQELNDTSHLVSLKRRLWCMNVAMDAEINENFDHAVIRRNHGVLYETLCGQFPELPRYTGLCPNWFEIYKVLLTQPERKIIVTTFDRLIPTSALSSEDVKQVLSEVMSKLLMPMSRREADILKTLLPWTDKPGGYSLSSEKSSPGYIVPLRRLSEVDKTLGTLKGIRGSLSRRVRDYRREGRSPDLRGAHTAPSVSIDVFLDVSGSMILLSEIAAGIRKYLNTMPAYKVRNFVFANTLAECIHADHYPDVGGGTNIACVMARLKMESPDVAILITDCEFAWEDFDLSACLSQILIIGIPDEIPTAIAQDPRITLIPITSSETAADTSSPSVHRARTSPRQAWTRCPARRDSAETEPT